MQKERIMILNQYLKEFIAPLIENTPIEWFGRTRIWRDGHVSMLHTNLDLLKASLSNGSYGKIPSYDVYTNGKKLWSNQDWLLHNNPEFCATILTYTNRIDTIFGLVEKSEDYCDIFYFGDNREDTQILGFYMNNSDRLTEIITLFKENAKEIAENIDEERLLMQNKPIAHELKNIKTFLLTSSDLVQSLLKEKFNVETTLRETEVLVANLIGLTAKRTAEILCLSKRTIENNLYGVRLKLEDTPSSLLRYYLFQQTGVLGLLTSAETIS